MKKSKKSAIETSTLVLYIILVATTLTLAGAATMYAKLATKDAAKKACEWDINKAALSKKLPDIKEMFTRGHRQTSLTNCRRDKLGNLEIRYKDVVENGVINQDKAHKIIADEMAECWKMAGAGKKDPFSNWKGEDESYCMICTTLKFDEKLMDLYRKAKTGEDLRKYTIQPIYPYLITEEIERGETYFEFLYNKEAIKYEDIKQGTASSFIYPDSTIIIQMYKLKEKSMKWFVGKIIVGGVLAGTGILLAIPTGGLSLVGALGGIAALAGTASAVVTFADAFADCEDCNAIGGLQLVPPEQEFDIEFHVNLGDKEKQIPLCSIIVN